MKIKKGWKITWITLGSLVGLLLLTVVVALWLIFTPSKLTKIVNSLAGRFVTCDAQFGNVDLTLLSTFPDAGLKIEDVVIVNPMATWDTGDGPANDTLACIGSLTVGIDVKAFLKENKVIVHEVLLYDVCANLYIARDGSTNFDIFPPSEQKDDDTTGAELPGVIDLKKIKIDRLNAGFHDRRDSMDAEVQGLALNLKGELLTADGAQDLDATMRIAIEKVLFAQGENLSAGVQGFEAKVDATKAGEQVDADIRLEGKRVDMLQRDSAGRESLKAGLDCLLLKMKGDGSMDSAHCRLNLGVEKGTLSTAGTEMVNGTLRESKKDLLAVDLPDVAVMLNKKEVRLGEGKVKLDDYALLLKGLCLMATDERPLTVDVDVETDGKWRVKPLLDIVPEEYVGFRKGMDVDGEVAFAMKAAGTMTDSTMPAISGSLALADGRFHAPKMLPYKINKIKGKMGVDLCLDKRKESRVTIETLSAHTQGTDLTVSGRVDDLLGDMRVDARVKGNLPLDDVKPMMPNEMNIKMAGDADVDISAKFAMSQLQKEAYDKVKATGTVRLKNLDVVYDSIHAEAPRLDIALQLPAKTFQGKMGEAHVSGSGLKMAMGQSLNAEMDKPDIGVGFNNLMKEQLVAAFDLKAGESSATMNSMSLSFNDLSLNGTVRLDSTQGDVLKQYNPRFSIATHKADMRMPQIGETVHLQALEMDYRAEAFDIKTVKVALGQSNFELYGTVENLEAWMDNKAMLRGDLNFTSDYADVDQLMDMFSGSGIDEDTLHAMRVEDTVPADANSFIVPRNVNITLNTHIKRSLAFGNDLHDVAGTLTVNDGRVVLDQMGFVCKAATMQLTALYRSPRPGNLFAALDFHLLDINIDELIDMIPAIDTLVPMLSAFDGNANFHLAGETYMDAYYRPKLESIKGAAAISGQDLVVLDNSSLSTIAKLMRFKSWKDKDDKIKIDSLSVEMTCMDMGHGCEIEVLPFLLNVGSYQICASGVQGVDKSCSYHLELLKNPLLAKVGVDVRGSLVNPKISLGKVIYADLFRPKRQGVAEKKALEIKTKVRQALEANVR
ncbi:MAG: hypothetical protein IJ745_06920 [Bacteroidales bacterium]|nr:hypothetical protein [Bacteroidales bacterium]